MCTHEFSLTGTMECSWAYTSSTRLVSQGKSHLSSSFSSLSIVKRSKFDLCLLLVPRFEITFLKAEFSQRSLPGLAILKKL